MNYVIADIEWIEKGSYINPTQISAIKVNSDWNGLSHFSEKIKPRSKHFHTWEHVAYTGGMADSFLSARSAFHVLEDFSNWLDSDDVILWWFSTGKETYSALINSMHKYNPPQKQLVLRSYLDCFLNGKRYNKWSAYDTAKALALPKHGKEHDSFADVLIVKDILKAINFPQELLEKEPACNEHSNKAIPMPYMGYVYDSGANLLHIACCQEIGNSSVYTNNMNRYIKKKVPPCPVCLQKEYKEQKRQMYLDIVQRLHCKFIYTSNSKVFHKASCNHLLDSLDIMGCQKYATAIETSRRPCKFCNPIVDDEQKKKSKGKKISYSLPSESQGVSVLNGETRKALMRLKQAQEERNAVDFKAVKTADERHDILILTGTVFGFYVGKGYNNFHLKNCPRLKQLTSITGFKTYGDAVAAGYTACKTCKPTKKFNVNLSIPVTSIERTDERVEDLYTYCAAYGYPCSRDDEYFYVKTPVGKWKIDLISKPVKLKHINLVSGVDKDEYHDQPRLFLSLTDAILYIRKHDNNILK